jgi:SAM-dependent methyltransferase
MTSISAEELNEIVRCPRCRSRLDLAHADRPRCTNVECALAKTGFLRSHGQLVLVDFERSIFEASAFERGGSVVPRVNRANPLWRIGRRVIFGSGNVSANIARRMIRELKAVSAAPRLLMIGGGTVGGGTEALYEDEAIVLTAFDVYVSANTQLVADGHQLPFADSVFDGVWIQAVLEHVLEPHAVAGEIHRVLKDGGLVYADTPFMQQVHEGPYDFTRFTRSGQRWLFRRFEELDAGVMDGAGVTLVWAIRYFIRALGAPDRVAMAVSAAFFWLRWLEPMMRRRPNADGASGTYFLGRKTGATLSPKEMVAYYDRQLRS